MDARYRNQNRRIIIMNILQCLLVLILVLSSYSFAGIATCLTVNVDQSIDKEKFRKIVASEIKRHPTHELVDKECETSMNADFFKFENSYQLTLQMKGTVPLRYSLASISELDHNLSKGVSLLLQNEPVHLRKHIATYAKTQRAYHNLRKNGITMKSIEIFQNNISLDQKVISSPGLSLGVSKGDDYWHIFSRFYITGLANKAVTREPSLKMSAGVEAGLLYEFFLKDMWSPWVSGAFGIQNLQFEQKSEDFSRLSTMSKSGATIGFYTGIKLFRWNTFNYDIYAGIILPLFSTEEVDSDIFDVGEGFYTPSLQFGAKISI